MEYNRPKIDYPTKEQIEAFHIGRGMKHKMTPEEIKKIKIEFVKFITKNRKFESKSEVKEALIRYRKLFAIRDDIESLFVNSMITRASNVPDELIDKPKIVKKEIIRLTYKCPTCNEQMFDMWSFKRTSYGRNIVSHTKTKTKEVIVYDLKQISSPNEFQVICLNRECPRYSKLLDKAILEK